MFLIGHTLLLRYKKSTYLLIMKKLVLSLSAKGILWIHHGHKTSLPHTFLAQVRIGIARGHDQAALTPSGRHDANAHRHSRVSDKDRR